MTTTLGHTGMRTHRRVERREAVQRRSLSVSLGMVGLVTVVISAWGAIVPYWGPTFGFSADRAPSWHWSLTHSVLALVPGALGFLVGITFFASVRASTFGRRLSLGVAGIVAVACGAWFVIGPVAWPVISSVNQYFVPAATPLRSLANQVGYALGPGLILAACGAFALGWATRHRQPLETAAETRSTDVAPVTSPARTAGGADIATGATDGGTGQPMS